MSAPANSAAAYIDMLRRKAPEYLDLLTAETEEQFETAFEVLLGEAVAQLERQRKNQATLEEVGLTGALAMALTMPGLTVTPEAHSNGHVDLFIRADHCVPERIKLGEAKIYRGPAYHVKGLAQLLGRYTTGREGRGLLITYFRDENIAGLVQKLREKMDAALPCKQQGKTSDHLLKWSFRSTHTLASGDDHEVGHIGCNLFAG
jgi:hypothetical protein